MWVFPIWVPPEIVGNSGFEVLIVPSMKNEISLSPAPVKLKL